MRPLSTSMNLYLNLLGIKLNRHIAHGISTSNTTDALNNIAKSMSLQGNLHFINDIPIFKTKDPQFFDK